VKRVSGAWAASTLVKGDVGLGNVDNTADTAKPVSTAQQTALDGKQALNAALTSISGILTPADNDIIQRKSSAWVNRTMAQLKTDLVLVKADVGLGNVDNTSDVAKPVSTATQTALDGKQALDSDLTTLAGLAPSDGTFIKRVSGAWAAGTLVKADVGLGSVDNTADTAKPVSTAQQTALDGKQTLDSDLTAIAGFNSAIAGAIASDGSGWVKKTYSQFKTALSLVKADVGLGSVDNTADTAKPVSTAQQTALDGKQALNAALTSISGLSPSNDDIIQRKAGVWINRTMIQLKTDLSLGNVDNTSDTAKPISTATQTALDSKQASDIDLTDIASLIPTNNDIIQRKSGSWVNRTLAQLSSDLGLAATYQPLDSDLTAIAALAPADGTFIKRASSAWTAATLTKSDVGLGNVDNTSDSSKNSATVTLNSKTIDGGTF
jgi:ribosomal protein S13